MNRIENERLILSLEERYEKEDDIVLQRAIEFVSEFIDGFNYINDTDDNIDIVMNPANISKILEKVVTECIDVNSELGINYSVTSVRNFLVEKGGNDTLVNAFYVTIWNDYFSYSTQEYFKSDYAKDVTKACGDWNLYTQANKYRDEDEQINESNSYYDVRNIKSIDVNDIKVTNPCTIDDILLDMQYYLDALMDVANYDEDE